MWLVSVNEYGTCIPHAATHFLVMTENVARVSLSGDLVIETRSKTTLVPKDHYTKYKNP